MVANKKTIYRAFEWTGLSLKSDGSEDGQKTKFQVQDVGILEGLSFHKKLKEFLLITFINTSFSFVFVLPLFDNAVIWQKT